MLLIQDRHDRCLVHGKAPGFVVKPFEFERLCNLRDYPKVTLSFGPWVSAANLLLRLVAEPGEASYLLAEREVLPERGGKVGSFVHAVAEDRVDSGGRKQR